MVGMESTESAPNLVEIKVVGKSGQISIGKSDAGKTLRLNAGEVLARPCESLGVWVSA